MSPVDPVELLGCLGVTPCVLSADGEAECVAERGQRAAQRYAAGEK